MPPRSPAPPSPVPWAPTGQRRGSGAGGGGSEAIRGPGRPSASNPPMPSSHAMDALQALTGPSSWIARIRPCSRTPRELGVRRSAQGGDRRNSRRSMVVRDRPSSSAAPHDDRGIAVGASPGWSRVQRGWRPSCRFISSISSCAVTTRVPGGSRPTVRCTASIAPPMARHDHACTLTRA